MVDSDRFPSKITPFTPLICLLPGAQKFAALEALLAPVRTEVRYSLDES